MSDQRERTNEQMPTTESPRGEYQRPLLTPLGSTQDLLAGGVGSLDEPKGGAMVMAG